MNENLGEVDHLRQALQNEKERADKLYEAANMARQHRERAEADLASARQALQEAKETIEHWKADEDRTIQKLKGALTTSDLEVARQVVRAETAEATLAACAALPRYEYQLLWPAHGGSQMVTDPENPERGEWVKASDLFSLLLEKK